MPLSIRRKIVAQAFGYRFQILQEATIKSVSSIFSIPTDWKLPNASVSNSAVLYSLPSSSFLVTTFIL
nr:MAG TPA: hypothetical protein [Bacteriophage sp.]